MYVHSVSLMSFSYRMCDDYNLCENCEERSLDIHDKYHVLIVLPHSCLDPPARRQISCEFYDPEITEEQLKLYKKANLI